LNIYTRKQRWKLLLLVTAIAIGVVSLLYTQYIVSRLSDQEKQNVELWAQGIRQLSDVSIEAGDISFALEVIRSNNTVPMILADENGEVISFRNIDSTKAEDPVYLKNMLEEMKTEHEPIPIVFGSEQEKNYVYYKDSTLLYQLRYYPIFQLAVIALFILVSYLAFSSSRKAEQNQVWVGMAKETAHQLGTPLSSLVAWVEYLKQSYSQEPHLQEMEKDLGRLETIADRFSKIGSAPSLERENIQEIVENSVNYIRTRTSNKVSFAINNLAHHDVFAPINSALFEWVLENLFKNAIDAIEGSGEVSIQLTDQQQFIYIDISDTGKGIAKSKFKTVFKPGYTSKNRGWGLGLSLSKRIIEEYHAGHIFVKSSELNKGTTFRIVLRKQI